MQDFFSGKKSDDGATPYAEDYDIDDESEVPKIPSLVCDADSSQISTIIDALDGKNLAVIGPPGTGKSQTITNLISAALEENKTVLFVAQKMAALEVVQKRLDEVGLGDFILEMHANKANKETILQSLKRRMELSKKQPPKELEDNIRALKDTVSYLRSYLNLVKRPICNMDYNYHDIVYKFRSSFNDNFPTRIEDFHDATEITQVRYNELMELFDEYSNIAIDVLNKYDSLEDHPMSFLKERIDIIELEELKVLLEDLIKKLKPQHKIIKEISKDLSLKDIDYSDLSLLKKFKLSLSTLNIKEDVVFSIFDEFNDDNTSSKLNKTLDKLEKINENLNFIQSKIIDFDKEKETLEVLDKIASEYNNLDSFNIENQKPNSLIKLIEVTENDNERIEFNYDITKQFIGYIGAKESLEESIILNSKISHINEFLDNFIPALSNIDEDVLGGCRSVDSDRGKFIENINKILYGSANHLLTYSEEIKEIKNLKEYLKNRISLNISEDHHKLRQAGQYLMHLRWFDFHEKFSRKYKEAKDLFYSYSLIGDTLKDAAIGNILFKTSLYLERSKKLFSNNEVKEYLGRIWKDEDTNFTQIVTYINFLQVINSIKEETIKDFIFNSIINLDSDSLRILSKSIANLANENSDFIPISKLTINNKSYENYIDYKTDFEKFYSGVREIIKLSKELSFYDEEPDKVFLYKDTRKLVDEIKTIQLIKKEIEESKIISNFSATNISQDEIIESYQQYKKINQILDNVKRKENCSENFFNTLRKKVLSKDYKVFVNNLFSNLSKIEEFEDDISLIDSEISVALKQNISKKFNSHVEKINWVDQMRDNINTEDINQFLTFRDLEREIKISGLGNFLDRYKTQDSMKNLPRDFEHYVYRSIAKKYSSENNRIISKYDGNSLDAKRDKLDEIDQRIKKLNVDKIISKLSGNIIPQGSGGKSVKNYTDDYLLQHYKDKTKRAFGNLTLRHVIKKSYKSIQSYKPCWMMSPYSVAKNLPKISNLFDLVVIDEASQMPPEDSIGSMLRGKNIIIVGDNQQLPPTKFFEKIESEEAEIEDESVLEQAMVSFRPVNRLNWHYRSKHESLIAPSNKEFYDNKLIVFPSPKIISRDDINNDLGLTYEYVEDAEYQSGLNPIEADIVVDRAIEHMTRYKNDSLILVAMNKAQSELISQKYETRKDQEYLQDCYEFEEKWKNTVEPFEIKNLETVQGDERDAIIISTVYGKDKSGQVMQRFGPINKAYGHRRLNVLFTRAKKRNHVVSSLHPNDIRVDGKSSRGTKVFANFIEYAKTGNLNPGEISDKKPETPFEKEVKEIIENKGYEVKCQVGVAGYRIDLAVKHPNWPDGFLAGIECDGATYHSGNCARDRDVARQKILQGLGWNIHRIWSTDWFNNPNQTAEKMFNQLDNWMSKIN